MSTASNGPVKNTGNIKTGRPIVVGVDGSEPAQEALRYAAHIARRRELPLRIVYGLTMPEFYTGMVPPPPEAIEALEDEGHQVLDKSKEIAQEIAPHTHIDPQLVTGPGPTALIESSHSAAMVVIGSRGAGGFMHRMLGSTAIAVSTHAASPVLVLRGEVPEDLSTPVVVGMDDSPASMNALTVAFEEAHLREAPLSVVTAWVEGEYKTVFSPAQMANWEPVGDVHARWLAEQVAERQERYPDVEVSQIVTQNKPRDELLERSHDAQLVVVGSRGRGGFRGLLLGSTSQALMLHAHCPVLIVREGIAEEQEETMDENVGGSTRYAQPAAGKS